MRAAGEPGGGPPIARSNASRSEAWRSPARAPLHGQGQQRQAVGRGAGEGRERAAQALLVAWVDEQSQMGDQVEDLSRAHHPRPCAATAGTPRARSRAPQRQLGAGADEDHDLAGARLPAVDEFAHALRDQQGLGGRGRPRRGRQPGQQRGAMLIVGRPGVLVGHQQLDDRRPRRRRIALVATAVVGDRQRRPRHAVVNPAEGCVDQLEDRSA